ncbi:hypothetical protein, partial [Pseudomonas sp. 2822-15]|uniref:hypothetical protein n=1 Tax=Pseudomonas sp. 2822-15 TaxID=1712677 RepID=UPI001C47D092
MIKDTEHEIKAEELITLAEKIRDGDHPFKIGALYHPKMKLAFNHLNTVLRDGCTWSGDAIE